jgi:hypothetical protein
MSRCKCPRWCSKPNRLPQSISQEGVTGTIESWLSREGIAMSNISPALRLTSNMLVAAQIFLGSYEIMSKCQFYESHDVAYLLVRNIAFSLQVGSSLQGCFTGTTTDSRMACGRASRKHESNTISDAKTFSLLHMISRTQSAKR